MVSYKRTSFRRKPESSLLKHFWTPAFAGVTAWLIEILFKSMTLPLKLEPEDL